MAYTRVRNKIKITNKRNSQRHMVSVFRSNRFIVASLMTPDGKTIGSFSSREIDVKGTPIEKAKLVGSEISKIAKNHKVSEIVFDRNKYAYHGQVKALAEGAREAGLKF